jgi:hypothetical protein
VSGSDGGSGGIDAWLWELDPDTRWLVQMHRSGRIGQFDHQLASVGACERPVWLRGQKLVKAVASGLVVAGSPARARRSGRYRCGA